jgi:hypothetical protein
MDPALQKLLTDLIEQLKDSSKSKKDGSTFDFSNAKKLATDLEYLKKRTENLTESIIKANEKSKTFSKMLSPIPQTLSSVQEELEALDEAIEKTTDSADKAALQAKKDALVNAAATADNIAIAKKFGESLKKIGAAGIQSAGAFAKGLQSGQSGIELGTGLMTSALDMAGSASAGAGQVAGSMGQVMMSSTNPKLKALGAIAAVAGPALGMLGESASKLAKFGVEVLSKEVEKTVKAFNTASASGAMFADGMTGLRNASNDAGLTVDQFANVLQKNSADLAASGLGVAEGAKRVGGALRAGGDTMKTQLLNLGYGFEEQAELTAKTIANMRRTGGGKATDQEIATQTQKYAENLRTIAAITGEDAKKKADEAQQQNQILAFQAELAKKTPEQRAAIDAAMATMTEQEKKNFRDRVVLGNVINQEGAIYESTIAGAKEKGEAALALFNNNLLTADANAKLNAQYGEQIKDSVLANEAFNKAAYAVGGQLADVAKAGLDAVNQANIYTKEAVTQGIAGVQAQKNATDKLTQEVIGAEIAAQKLKLALEVELTKAIGSFAKVANEMLGEVQKMLKDLGIGKGPNASTEEKGFFSKANDWLKEKKVLSTGLNTVGAGAMIGGAAASVTGVGAIGGVPLATIGAITSGLGMLAGMMGYAEGGVSSGPNEGYLTKLHGTEAIVPLPDGKSIPVNLDGLGSGLAEVFDKKIDQLISVMSGKGTPTSTMSAGSAADTMEAFMKLLENTHKDNQEIISQLRDHKDISQKLLYAST